MRFDVVTLFPELFDGMSRLGVVGRAIATGEVTLALHDLRQHGVGRHRSVDDTPYGGGAGMVMRVDVVVACLESFEAGHRVLLTPQGRPFDQRLARELTARPAVTLVCGRYEGFDERVRDEVQEEVSLGDFVLSGGEIAAMAIVDACVRLLPGVLGNAASVDEESHSPTTGGLLEYPQYTRPAEFRGRAVPEVLLGGNHAAVAAWRREQAALRTRARRPDLLRGTAAGGDGE